MAGVALSADGCEQALRLAQRFAGQPIAAVWASPVQRAQETAAPIARQLRLPVQVEPGFEEIDFGAWTGRSFEQLGLDPAWQAWNQSRSLACCPGGETMHQAQSRALLALGRLRGAYPGQEVVVVSHSDMLKAMLAPALGLPLDRLHRLTLDPASVSTMVVFDNDLRVDGLNR